MQNLIVLKAEESYIYQVLYLFCSKRLLLFVGGGGGGGGVFKVNTIQSETQVIFLLLFFPLFISCSSGSILEIILGNFIHKGLIIKRRKRMFNLFVSYPVQVQCSLSTGN